MRVLVIEDSDDKFNLLQTEILASYAGTSVNVTRSSTLASANKRIYETKYDLIIIDLMIPLREGTQPEDISEDVISIIETSDANCGTGCIALSGFEDLVDEQRALFADAGIILVHYDRDLSNWKKHISGALASVRDQTVFDFVIVCALDKERDAYKNTGAKCGALRNIRGLDCMPLKLGELSGVCVKLPRMGLVEASIGATRAIDRFNPKILAMSGICAGVSGNSKIGNLILADICWEYQAGKWAGDKFKIEHYDVSLEPNTKTFLSQLIATEPRGDRFKAGLIEDEVVFERMIVGPMATGSAVIASIERMAEIEAQHRKIAGLDMEMYGLYKAAELSISKPVFFGAKVVVDLADSAKGDKYHEYGSILSARFALAAIETLWVNINPE
jgi:adenosylhomocysteine nucleosidase